MLKKGTEYVKVDGIVARKYREEKSLLSRVGVLDAMRLIDDIYERLQHKLEMVAEKRKSF